MYFFKKKTKENLINIGTGIEKSITEYAKFIMKHLGVKLKLNTKKNLDGTYRKLLDVSLAKNMDGYIKQIWKKVSQKLLMIICKKI